MTTDATTQTWVNPLRSDKDIRLPHIAGPSGLVLFGVTGDLARKKLLPAMYDLANRGLLPANFTLIGFGRRDWSKQDFQQYVREAIVGNTRTSWNEQTWEQLSSNFEFVTGRFDDHEAFQNLSTVIATVDSTRGTSGNWAFYLSIPPSGFASVCDHLQLSGLSDQSKGWRRLIIEKPFGHDQKAAKKLNTIVNDVFPEESVFRIDHYLGKETVQNIMAFRFANTLFEPLFNNKYVDNVQITMAEDIGLGGRAGYYDGIGAARDVIQNHLLQLFALIAMDKPKDFSSEELERQKIHVLAKTTPLEPLADTTSRGQYTPGWQGSDKVLGLKQEDGFNPDSTTETYAAITLSVDIPQWSGVPFFLRTGKRMPRRVTEIAVILKENLHESFDPNLTAAQGCNTIVLRIQPDEGIRMRFGAKVPGSIMEIQDVNMDFSYANSFTQESPEAYERLILDVLLDEASLFPSNEEVELSWKILDPVLNFWASDGEPESYLPGSWGPTSADTMLSRTQRQWRKS